MTSWKHKATISGDFENILLKIQFVNRCVIEFSNSNSRFVGVKGTVCIDNFILFLSESLELLESCGVVEQEDLTIQTIGVLSLDLGHYTMADKCFTKAMAMAVELKKQAAFGKVWSGWRWRRGVLVNGFRHP